MTTSPWKSPSKIRGISTKTQKMKFIGGGNKSCLTWFKLLFQVFSILMKSQK